MIYFSLEIDFLSWALYVTSVDMQRCSVFYHKFSFFIGPIFNSVVYFIINFVFFGSGYTLIGPICNDVVYILKMLFFCWGFII